MFDIGWSEIAVIAVVALVVIGPKDLPKALHTVGKWVAKARSLAREFQNNVDDMVRQAELDELRKQVEQARNFNLTQELEKTIDPDGALRQPLNLADNGTKPAETPKPASPAVPDPEQEADLAAVAMPTIGAPPVTPLEPTPVASPAAAVQVEPVTTDTSPEPTAAPVTETPAPTDTAPADETNPVEAPKTQGERP